MIKICIFRVKYIFCLILFFISGIAPLITCYELKFKNIFKKFISSFMNFSYSAFQILLQILVLFNFLTVIYNLITVNVLIVSCYQTKVRVFITNNIKGMRSSKKRLKLMQYFNDKIGSNGVLFLQETHSESKVEQKWKKYF